MDGALRLRLFGCFRLTADTTGGTAMNVPEGTQRLLALLALRGRSTRHDVAAMLWPGVDKRAYLARLRTALWRLPKDAQIVELSGHRLGLTAAVRTDIERLTSAVDRIAAGRDVLDSGRAILAEPFAGELLSGWYDDWVLYERERLRALQLDALELTSTAMLRMGWAGPALEAGLRAVGADPLRESARRCVIAAYLAEDNLVEAVLHYNGYDELLADELGVRPSTELRGLVHAALRARHRQGEHDARQPVGAQLVPQQRTGTHGQRAVEPRAVPAERGARLPLVALRQQAGDH